MKNHVRLLRISESTTQQPQSPHKGTLGVCPSPFVIPRTNVHAPCDVLGRRRLHRAEALCPQPHLLRLLHLLRSEPQKGAPELGGALLALDPLLLARQASGRRVHP